MLALLFSDKAIAKNGTVTPADTPVPAPTAAPATDPTASPAQTDAPAPSYSKLTYGTRSSSAVYAMQERLRALLGTEAVNVKATTEERLGFTGRKEGIAEQAAALIYMGNAD